MSLVASTPEKNPQWSVLGEAADFGEGDDVGDKRNNEQPRLAGDNQQNSRTQDQSNQQINQSRQRKFH